MPIAAIVLEFDPVARAGGLTVRVETVALGAVLLVGLLLAARIAGTTPAEDRADPFVPAPGLRRDDLLFVVLGAIAGAVVGGRLSHALLHLDYYASDPFALVNPSAGSAELAGAVVGGALAAAVIGTLVDGTAGRWLHVATLPTLLVLALGKLTTVLGGRGQGQPADLPWATAYAGPGPWASLAPATPSHPAQLYEAAAAAIVLALVVALIAAGPLRRPDGRAFLVAVALWALARAVAATAWRDPAVLGPLNAGQLIALAVAIGAFVLAAVRVRAEGRGPASAGDLARLPAEPSWPDPETRPRF